MESYLMMLYVTLEQESALKKFFMDQGWSFCKPDLSVTTEKLGPPTCFRPNNVENEHLHNYIMGYSSEQPGKRKLLSKKTILFDSQCQKGMKYSRKTANKSLENETDGQDTKLYTSVNDTDKRISPANVQDEDSESKTIKVEVTDDDDDQPIDSCYGDAYERIDAESDETDVDCSSKEASEVLDASERGTSSKQGSCLTEEDEDSAASSSKSQKKIAAAVQRRNTEFYPYEKSFTYSPGLNYHLHHGIKPAVKCTFCHKTFTTIAAKKRHERTVHAAEKKFKCDHCDERFAFKWLMEAHVARKHDSGKLFNCACGALFNRQSNLTQHMNICEATQKPGNERVCDICRKTFKCKKYLDVHMKFQHDVLTLPSVCGICGESFTRPWSLTRHVKRQHSTTELSVTNTD